MSEIKNKESITIRTNGSSNICTICDNFDENKLLQLPNCKGYCKAKNIALYRLDYDCCQDFVGAIPKIEIEMVQDG